MKKLMVLILLFLADYGLAQQRSIKLINRDTINLRGYIYDYQGKPVRFLYIESAQEDFTYNEFKAWTRTDTNGYFEIKGAKLNDTLKIGKTNLYGTPVYHNKDSRYLLIYLPTPKILDLNSSSPIQIIEKRKYSKVVPEFKLQVLEGRDIFADISQPPRYKFGNEQFLKIISKNIGYPEAAVKNNVEGIVEIGFTVERDGSLVNLKILKGIGYGCDEAVIKAFENAPHWQPGIDHWVPIAMNASLTVQFELSGK